MSFPAPSPSSGRRAARRAELQSLSHARLVALLLQAEGLGAAEAEEEGEKEDAETAVTASSMIDGDSSGARPAERRLKHAHSPTALEGEPPAKHSRHMRKQEHRRAEQEKAKQGAQAPNKGAGASDREAEAAAAAAAAADPASAGAPPSASLAAPPAARSPSSPSVPRVGPSVKLKGTDVDWSAAPRRHIALKLMYLGSSFAGFAIQPTYTSMPTVEGELIRAILLTKLAPDRDAARVTRCGRTDKGVHSSGQVVSVQLRSRMRANPDSVLGMLPKQGWREALAEEKAKKQEFMDEVQPAAGDTSLYDAQGYLAPAALRDSMCPRCGLPGVNYSSDIDCTTHEQEFDYVRMLNGVLPPSIRIVSWQPVSPAFNARFSCSARTYRYFFHADELQLQRMREAAQLLVGSHDFRNFCKVDPSMSSHFIRCLTNIEVKPCAEVPEDCVQQTSPWPCDQQQWDMDSRKTSGGGEGKAPAATSGTAASSSAASAAPSAAAPASSSSSTLHPDTLCELLIHGNAFLYHQVRCMAAVLFLVGRGFEAPSIISRLLDVAAQPTKPQYDMAPENPLVLYDTFFPSLPLTPGFDYQTKPASKPEDLRSFVGMAAKQQEDILKREAQQQQQQPEDDTSMTDVAQTADVNAETARPIDGSAGAVSAASSSASAPAASSESAASTPAAVAAASSSSPPASSSPSPSPAVPPPCLNLYPSAPLCLRNVELVFAHFHGQWRNLSMEAKVMELFVNQAARNVQAVRNETDRPQMAQAMQGPKKTHAHQQVHIFTNHRKSDASLVRSYAPLLAATNHCRGQGLRDKPYALSSGPHTPLLRRPQESSYAEKVAGLKGKKLARHESVKEMSDKFKKQKGQSYAPTNDKVQ